MTDDEGDVIHKVRCFKCGAPDVRLVMGSRQIIHARCKACDANLLAEILGLEQEVRKEQGFKDAKRPITRQPEALKITPASININD